MSLVLLSVSIPGLRDRLLLPDNARIIGAGTVQYCIDPVSDAAALVLTVDMPDAPEGAVAVEPVYRHTGHRDPVEFERFTWRAADGTEIKQGDGEPAARPAPEPPAFMKDVREDVFRDEGVTGVRLTYLPTGVTAEGPARDLAVGRLTEELFVRGHISVNTARSAYGLPPFGGDFAERPPDVRQ